MTQVTYTEQLISLKTAKIAGVKAPHKPILLLSVIDLIERGLITSNRIELSEALERQFAKNWARYVGDSLLFQAKIATPFWHLQNESFWRLISFDGVEVTKNNIVGSMYSVNNLKKQVKYSEIDSELFELLQTEDMRAKLRVLLIATYLKNRQLQKIDILSLGLIIGASMLPLAS